MNSFLESPQSEILSIDPWYLENLRCPVDGTPLSWHPEASVLTSGGGNNYPVIDGVPIMLPREVSPTLEAARASVRIEENDAPWYLKSIFHDENERPGEDQLNNPNAQIDPVVSHLIGHTNGLAYWHMVGKLREYPIPEIRLEAGNGKSLLDIGCGWGRWCISAARKGWKPVGMDPSLGAVMAARRVAKKLGIEARFLVGDARFMPFKPRTFNEVFSYSVVQHLSESDAEQVIRHVGNVLKPGGGCMVQMPLRWGIRCMYNQIRRGFRTPEGFEVRYWTLQKLREVFEKHVGTADVSVDCYFGIGWQASDAHLMPWRFRVIILASEFLRAASLRFSVMRNFADSVYIKAVCGQPGNGGQDDKK